jgi:hypothetical protein
MEPEARKPGEGGSRNLTILGKSWLPGFRLNGVACHPRMNIRALFGVGLPLVGRPHSSFEKRLVERRRPYL